MKAAAKRARSDQKRRKRKIRKRSSGK